LHYDSLPNVEENKQSHPQKQDFLEFDIEFEKEVEHNSEDLSQIMGFVNAEFIGQRLYENFKWKGA
jgi:hypothetical protein